MPDALSPLLLAGLALGSIAAPQAGTGRLSDSVLHRAEGPLTRVRAKRLLGDDGQPVWDYTVLGRTRPVLSGNPAQAVPRPHKALVKCFENTQTNGFFGVGSNGTEWMDWAKKDAGKTDIVGAFALGYGSNARGSSEPGGTGASLGVSFYSGTTGFCDRGTRVGDGFFFTGLPGATGTQTSPRFAVTVFLDPNSVFCLPDGKIGWAYFFDEPPLGTFQNSTGPLLAGAPTFASGQSNTCWNDVFDLWSSPDPVASCAGVFFTSGCNPPLTFLVPGVCSGFWIQIFEETISPGSSVVTPNASNPTRYTEVQAANVGEAWVTNVLLAANPAGTEAAGVIRFGVPGTLVPTGVALPSLLVNGSRLLVAGPAANITLAGPGNPKVGNVVIPKDLSYVGSTFHTQGFALILPSVRFQALNAISITIGAI